MNQKGQSLIEAAVLLPLLIGVFLFLGGVCYAIFGRAWLRYQMDQALSCSAEVQSTGCREKAFGEMKRYLPWGRLLFELNDNIPAAEVDWSWHDGRFHRETTLKLDSRLWR